MSDKSTCHLTGTIVGCTKDFDGKAVVCPIGFGGVIYEPGMKDNLASVPYMLRLGYQFWFGDYPYMVTPNGEEVPLYHKSNGYLGLRVHAFGSKEFPTTSQLKMPKQISSYTFEQPRQARIGYLSNDVILWHKRFCHVLERVLQYMQKHDLVYGLPKQFGTFSSKFCLTCGMGKSCCQHVGKSMYTDKAKMKSELAKLKEAHPGKYYPLKQLHLDTCDRDSPEIYGNSYFVVILDRSTDFLEQSPILQGF